MNDTFKHSNPSPTKHRMTRRSWEQHYSEPGIYHITLRVSSELRAPFGRLAGRVDAPQDSPDFPHVELTPVGSMVKEELLGSICRYYPMAQVEDFVIMPEHIHFLLRITDKIISKQGRETHLGQLIAGFKKGCNRRYWAITQQGEPAATKAAPASPASPAAPCALPFPGKEDPASPAAPAAPCALPFPGKEGPVSPAAPCALPFPGKEGPAHRAPSDGSSGRLPLFAPQYTDVIPISLKEIDGKRLYIRNNPLYRLLRTVKHGSLHTTRAAVDTRLTIAALRGYLERECRPWPPTKEDTDALCARLLLTAGATVACDAYGDLSLLRRRLLPVVCHRKDAPLFAAQKAACLQAAADGAVLVSARISKGEQDILDTALSQGYPVMRMIDNGIPDIYHPSAAMIDRCAEGHLLLVTPWQYAYRHKDEAISVPLCKTMNCVVQSLCHLRDDWWKT